MRIGAAYVRVSTTDQTEYSPESQIRLIMEYASKNNIVITEQNIFRDEGISGRNTEKRASFNRMISKAKQKEFDVILIYSTSRFARNLEDSIVYKSMLQRDYDIEVISITQPSVDKKTDMLTNVIYAVMDEWFSLDLSDNVKRGMTQKALAGGTQTSPPFGYDLPYTGAAFTVNEDEAKIIRYIFNEFLRGTSKWYIAKNLNEMGIKTKKGNKISTRNIYYILRNITYAGYSHWTPTMRAHWDFHNPDTIIAKAKHEQIIDMKIFEAVQRRLDGQISISKQKERPQEIKAHWLSGIIKCSKCGSSLIYNGVSKTRKSPFFRCGGYGKGYCKITNFILVDYAEKLLLDYFSTLFFAIDINYVLRSNQKNMYLDEVNLLNSKLQVIERKLSKAKEAFLGGVFSLDEFKLLKETADNEKQNILYKISNYRGNIVSQNDIKTIQNAYNILSNEEFNKEQKGQAIKSIIKSIIFDKSSGVFKIIFYK